MIVPDASAVPAILRDERERDRFRHAISRAGKVLISAGSVVELAAVAGRSDALRRRASAFVQNPYITVEPVTASQAAMAADAFRAWARGVIRRR